MPCLTCKRCLAFMVCMSEKEGSFMFALWVPVLNSQQSQCADHLAKDPESTQREVRMAISPGQPKAAGSMPGRGHGSVLVGPANVELSPPSGLTWNASTVLPFPTLGLGGIQAWLHFIHTVWHCFHGKTTYWKKISLPENWSLFLRHPGNIML